jgi:hypothetical protein
LFTRLTLLIRVVVAFALLTGAALAGTTGGIGGTVRDAATGNGLAGVRVTVTSASQVATATTDANGHFAFVSLAPDTYVVSVQFPGYDPLSQSGVTITADARQTLTLDLHRPLKTIGKVTSRSAADLVRPGTTADVYSINARQQDAVSSLGGGGNLDTAYSAIGSAAGAYVPSSTASPSTAASIIRPADRCRRSDNSNFRFIPARRPRTRRRRDSPGS